MDDETKILILPPPDSKRKVKVIDTLYEYKTYGDLLNKASSIEGELTVSEKEKNVRYEDKTQEEVLQDMRKKRRL